MNGFSDSKLRVLGLTAVVTMAGCSWVGNMVKSELSAYAEPKKGELSYIRLIGSRNVKVYPDSVCANLEVPGSGYPAGPQMGGQRKRDLGMPKPAPMPKHYVEIAARAQQPITIAFSFYSESISPGIAGTGVPATRASSTCYAVGRFIPEAGKQYEVVSNGTRNCLVTIVELVSDKTGSNWQRRPVAGLSGETCGG